MACAARNAIANSGPGTVSRRGAGVSAASVRATISRYGSVSPPGSANAWPIAAGASNAAKAGASEILGVHRLAPADGIAGQHEDTTSPCQGDDAAQVRSLPAP